MKIEEYLKSALSDAKIEGGDAAKICGYKYANSYYSKLSKQNLNLLDIIALTAALDKRLCVVPSSAISSFAAHDEIAPDYIFEMSDYLTDEQRLKIYELRERLSDKVDFTEWVDTLTAEQQSELFSNRPTEDTTEDYIKRYRAKKEDGSILMETVNFRQMIEVSGKEYKTAYEWINKVNADAEPYDEVLNWMRIEKLFDVMIVPADNTYIGIKIESDASMKYSVEETNADDTTILFVTASKEDAYAKAEELADGKNISVVRRAFDANNNPVGNKIELLQTWH